MKPVPIEAAELLARANKVLRGGSEWRDIKDAPREKPIIGWAPGWLMSREIWLDDYGTAYLPATGEDLEPQPTCWQLFPEPPLT